MGLTVKKVAGLTKPGRYLDSAGLYLQIISPTNRSWLLRYELRRRKRWVGLGGVETFSLEEARQRARKARQLLADGIDPLTARRAERAEQATAAARNKTFAEVTTLYFDAHAAGWSDKHRRDCLASLRSYAFPIIGKLPVAVVDESLVLDVLRPIWAAKTVTAKRLRQLIASVLDSAAAGGYRAGSNPARWEGYLEHLLAAPDRIVRVEHHAALPYAELPAFVAELREVPGVAARALEFLILTGARTNEVRGAIWDELDLKSGIWTIPAARMKANVGHRVPLSRQAVALLRALPRDGRFVFIGAKSGSAIGDAAIRRILKGLRAGFTAHGFRSSFRTWTEERTSYPTVLAEQALAHVIGTKVERAYRRTDLFEQRSRLMQLWADFAGAPVAVDREVTPLRRAGARS